MSMSDDKFFDVRFSERELVQLITSLQFTASNLLKNSTTEAEKRVANVYMSLTYRLDDILKA